jgi:hypothetical protein
VPLTAAATIAVAVVVFAFVLPGPSGEDEQVPGAQLERFGFEVRGGDAGQVAAVMRERLAVAGVPDATVSARPATGSRSPHPLRPAPT